MKNEDILKAARERLAFASDADEDNRAEALSDLEHLAGIQWDEQIKADREAEGRPCLTINRLPQFVRRVTGDLRRLNPAIRVLPTDDDATQETADLIRGIVRGIEYSSKASEIYEGAAESAAQCGVGNFRILTEYENDHSFNQVIRIRRIHNPFAVHWDPQAREATREDARWCLITEQMDEDDYKAAYPDAATVSVEADTELDGIVHWRSGADVIVAEYFWKEPVTKRIGLLPTGEIVENPRPPLNFVKERTVQTHKVMWAKVSGAAVLEGPQELPCRYIPVVSIIGEELHVGDKIIRTSVIRHARDPQRMYNYWRSASTEMIALQPKSPFLVTAKQIKGQEAEWAAANDTNSPYLIYSPDEKAPGVPQRAMPPVPSAGMSNEIMMAAEDMKSTTGIFDAALGARSTETSGIAIRQRQMEADVANSIYSDNLGRAVEQCGRIIVDMIPKVYDTARMVPMVDEDDKEGIVSINGQALDDMNRPVPLNDVTRGAYSVRVAVGPNYATRRQEAAEGMLQFVQAVPAVGQVAPDLIARAMEFPDADKLARRFAKTLPPELRDEQDPQAQQAAQQQQAMQMQAQQAAMEMQARGAQIDLRKAEAEATEAEADAVEAQAKATLAQVQAAAVTGQLDATIAAIVRQEVARALMGAQQPGLVPTN